MLFKSLILVAVLSAFVRGHTEEEIKELEKKCQDKHSVGDDIFIKHEKEELDSFEEFDITLKDDTVENHRCYVECLLSEFGLMKDGILELDALVHLTEVEMNKRSITIDSAKLKADVVTCTAEVAEGHCMVSYHAVKCLYNWTKEHVDQKKAER
uniref:Chemosensory protein n=1 Tax=Blattella germanica TaxID=6973 RepID=A0A109ZPL8_BLAGE|nr:chemosensory protein [Blattella germanica]